MVLTIFPEDLGGIILKLIVITFFIKRKKCGKDFFNRKVTSTLKVLMSLLLLENVGISPIGDLS